MKNLQELHNNEAILLMYLAGELAPHDHQDVELMLQSDPNLRRELGSLQETQQQINQALADLDRQIRPPVPETVATAGVCRMIQQWQEQRERMKSTLVIPRRRLMPRIWLSLAAAAAIAIGYLVWGAYHPPVAPVAQLPPPVRVEDDEKLGLLESTMNIADGLADTEVKVAAAMPGPDDLDSSADPSNQ
jgi:anti-sigma factor RsiW